MLNMSVFSESFFIGAGLIIAIGAQNAFVIKQGLQRKYVFFTAFICATIDIVLISSGVYGLGYFISGHPFYVTIASYGGACFLLFYGIRSFYAAYKGDTIHDSTKDGKTLKATVTTLLAFSLLNPHVYLDTVILLGSIGGRYSGMDRVSFIAGASSASVLWFFSIAYGAAGLNLLFKKKNIWRVMDLVIGFIMWFIAYRLLVKFV